MSASATATTGGAAARRFADSTVSGVSGVSAGRLRDASSGDAGASASAASVPTAPAASILSARSATRASSTSAARVRRKDVFVSVNAATSAARSAGEYALTVWWGFQQPAWRYHEYVPARRSRPPIRTSPAAIVFPQTWHPPRPVVDKSAFQKGVGVSDMRRVAPLVLDPPSTQVRDHKGRSSREIQPL